jgi:hypothetical protein
MALISAVLACFSVLPGIPIMPVDQLIEEILQEMDRVWGKEGLHGEPEEYVWLKEHYGITEEDDVRWQLTIQHHFEELPEEDQADEDVMRFLNDEGGLKKFLKSFLDRYQANSISYSA